MNTAVAAPDAPSFTDPAINADPFGIYAYLLRERPIYFDAAVGVHVVSRYEDIRRILTDPETFSSESWLETARETAHSERAKAMMALFETEGWVPPPGIGMLDDPRHKELRTIFDRAFRPSRVKEMEDEIRDTAIRMVEALPRNETVELVSAFSIPFPLNVICRQVGARHEDIWRIKHWMDALIDRAGFMHSPEDELASVRKEIEAQHYFKTVIDELRGNSNGTVLGDLVNTPLSDGRTLTDAELMSNLMTGIFLAGTETTTNSISAGMRFLSEQPALFRRLKEDRSSLKTFIEEVLRLESPAQGLYRVVTKEVELHGQTLQPGSVMHLRIGAANRDDRTFGCPAQLDVDRKNAGAHLAFGSGVHHCVGAPLARRELHWAFTALLDRFDGVALAPDQAETDYLPNYMFRAIRSLRVRFD